MSRRARPSVTERRAPTRRRLLDAAMEIVAKRGFDGASIDAIARKAGFSVGAVYSNFAGKDDLFLALFDEHVAWFEARLAELPDDEGEWIDFLLADPSQFLVFVEFWAYAVRTPRLRKAFAARMAELRAAAGAVLARRAGLDEAAAPHVGLLAMALGRGLALERLADPDAVPDGLTG